MVKIRQQLPAYSKNIEHFLKATQSNGRQKVPVFQWLHHQRTVPSNRGSLRTRIISESYSRALNGQPLSTHTGGVSFGERPGMIILAVSLQPCFENDKLAFT